MRTATIRADRTFGRDMTDVLVLPDLIDTELRDWEVYDATVEEGYEATKKALESSDIKAKCCTP